ncbi:hypothetical protein NDU88_006048 [Pleurodeles waltl]|uniref:Uncharacterized protein n=1 Tax=Pleurodeles waltl TaxID=8319 RepID=A0AAV7LVT6_PLEWA|nr:hypothetical protein NDU88_006048 [Pleurodeles waltl]
MVVSRGASAKLFGPCSAQFRVSAMGQGHTVRSPWESLVHVFLPSTCRAARPSGHGVGDPPPLRAPFRGDAVCAIGVRRPPGIQLGTRRHQ